MTGGLGEKAKTFIHSIDSLDATQNQIPSQRSAIDDVKTYVNPKSFYVSKAGQTQGWTCPQGRCWIVSSAQVANNNRSAIATLSTNYVQAWKDSIVCADSAAARDKLRYSDALEHITKPLIIAPAETINLTDQAYQAGDTVYFSIRYYEVDV